MTVPLLEAVRSEPVLAAAQDANSLAALGALGADGALADSDATAFSAYAVEVAALRLCRAQDDGATEACREAFRLLRALLEDEESRSQLSELAVAQVQTRAAVFGVLGDLYSQTRQLLADAAEVADDREGWDAIVEIAALRVWQLLIRKRGWADLDGLRELIETIRGQQAGKEPAYLSNGAEASDAWKLVAMYHLLRASEIVAEYTEHGSVGGRFDPVEQAEFHLDRARAAADDACDPDLAFLVDLLDLATRSLVRRSIWTAARGAGTRATEFVRQLAGRDSEQPFLELLPPQHQALVEEGLIGTGRRSVVVSLPTSAGKTLIAQFRILGALDRYEAEEGWVAYTAPTRSLVNQLTGRLRRDLAPLGIRVERFSPALEVDSVEAEILEASENPFRVVVTTPEKLDLLLRGGWVSELGRPLSLVVVDEAHNLGDSRRGLKLELLLATLNREARDASFLLMTPFIPNAAEIAGWLDPTSSQAVELGLEWLPNDRIVGLAKLERAEKRGNSRVVGETLLTSASSLHTEQRIELAHGRLLGLTYSQLNGPTNLATAAALALGRRGSTITLVGRPKYSWAVARRLAESLGEEPPDALAEAVGSVLAHEYGSDYPLVGLLRKGVAVHHAGLSDDVRLMIEALAERGVLRHIVATTTLAQGINFPISNVVLGSYQYPYGQTMPAEDFWNLAGRAGRINHGQPGVILLAAHDEERATALRGYLSRAATELNSTLLAMVEQAMERSGGLDLARLTFMGEWSSFAQFITHTYRMVGAEEFAVRVEQVLRGTLGFRELRAGRPELADELVRSVRAYAAQLSGKPISLVDSTGFSWESVSATLARMSGSGLSAEKLGPELFAERSPALRDAIGILLQVPELRDQLVDRLDPAEAQGDFLARVVKDWVAGMPLGDLAAAHFAGEGQGHEVDRTEALTHCCQRLFGSILPAVSWGISALQALAGGPGAVEGGPDAGAAVGSSHDIPSYVYYGVHSREAVALRLFGVPRTAALGLARTHGKSRGTEELREFLANSSPAQWTEALGDIGQSYFDAWRLTEPAT